MTRKNDRLGVFSTPYLQWSHLAFRAILNLCMPYTSRDEMTAAVEACIREAEEFPDESVLHHLLSSIIQTISNRCITEQDIDKHLMTSMGGSPPLDILVRTSGVKRLSDFLLWQVCQNILGLLFLLNHISKGCENTQIQFTDNYWPDVGLWDLIPIVLDYQRKVWAQPSCSSLSIP